MSTSRLPCYQYYHRDFLIRFIKTCLFYNVHVYKTELKFICITTSHNTTYISIHWLSANKYIPSTLHRVFLSWFFNVHIQAFYKLILLVTTHVRIVILLNKRKYLHYDYLLKIKTLYFKRISEIIYLFHNLPHHINYFRSHYILS
jgi:hypothetical protein